MGLASRNSNRNARQVRQVSLLFLTALPADAHRRSHKTDDRYDRSESLAVRQKLVLPDAIAITRRFGFTRFGVGEQTCTGTHLETHINSLDLSLAHSLFNSLLPHSHARTSDR